MNDLIQEYKLKELKRLKDREKMGYKFESGKIINLRELERKETLKSSIFDYFKHKHFLNDFNKETQVFLFITFTLNPRHNKKDGEEQMKSIQRQNEIFENHFSNITKHNKTEYIKIKELTKKGNIHLHTLFKIDKENIKKFIETIEKQREDNIGIVNIKSEKNCINFDKNKDYLQTFEINGKKSLIRRDLKGVEIKNYLLKGSFIELDELDVFEVDNVKNYILKYIKKNMETYSNNESKEHIIFKISNIKKLTTSQMTKKDKKKDFLSYYYFITTFEKKNTKNLDLIEMFENGKYFEEWDEWKKSKKITKPELLDLTKKENLEQYYNNIVDGIEEREGKETFKTKSIKEVLKHLEEHLENKKDIGELIKEEYIIQKELFEKDIETQNRLLEQVGEIEFHKNLNKKQKKVFKTTKKHFQKYKNINEDIQIIDKIISQVLNKIHKKRKEIDYF